MDRTGGMENAHDTLAPECTGPEARFPHRLGRHRTPPIRSTGTLVCTLEHDVTGRISSTRCETDGRKLTEQRRYAPTSVHVRRNPCSRSPDLVFTFTGLRTALVAAILITASCGENQSPVAPTPVPEPRPPVALRTLEIMGVPETGLPAGEVVQLTAQIRLPDGGTEAVFRPTWTSSNPEVATIEIRGTLVGLMVGQTEITASHQELEAKAHAEITPAQPNETLWRELAFNYLDCPPTAAVCDPLEERVLRRLPVTSPNFAIVSHTLSAEAITNLHEVLALGAEQITGEPYRGTIQEGNGMRAENWITIEGVKEQDYGTSWSCSNAFIPEQGAASASVGSIHGCILLGMDREEGSTQQAILHELGHAMGFWHTSNQRTLMFNATSYRNRTFSAQELYHTQLAYRHPRGTTYTEIKLSTFGPQRQLRPRQVDPRPIFIVD